MKTKLFFLKPAWAALALVLMFTACNLAGNDDDDADKTTLYTAIALAEMAKEEVAVSAANGADVAQGKKWVTPGTKAEFDKVINEAQTVAKDDSATQTQVDNAASALKNAIPVFNNAKGNGTKTTGFNQTEFDKLKTTAAGAAKGVSVSANGSDVPATGAWVTQAEMDRFNAAIANAGTAVSDSAYLALSNALAAFTQAKKLGSGSSGSGSSGGNDALEGTWVSDFLRIEASKGSFKQYLVPENKEVVRGTYTVSGNTGTAKITQINTYMFGGADKWVAWANLSAEYKAYVGGSETQQIIITGNTFTSNGMIFTKQTGTSGGIGGSSGNSEKTLVITNISAAQVSQGTNGILIGIFPVGTTAEQALLRTGIVAGADENTLSGGPSSYTITAPLYPISGWTSNTYDIYLMVYGESGISYYRKQNVPFTTSTIQISAADFEELSLSGGEYVPGGTNGPVVYSSRRRAFRPVFLTQSGIGGK
jgi:hypothetical protein